ncbi:MAG: uracil phosphoribosyltransferase [Salibacteraceae bacterium]|jgi:uracil phosphoribosyltransferase
MAKIFNLGDNNSIFNQFIMEIRNVDVQKDSMRFRRNIERMGEIFAYEISKHLNYSNATITTPLGECDINLINRQPVIATVLRAGLPLHQGILNYFDQAENSFVSAYRKHITADDFEVRVEYISGPSLEGKTLILCDPMLASGQSMILSYKALIEQYGEPEHVHIVSIISSSEGTDYLMKNTKSNVSIWTGAMDSEMTAQSYIVPGLGDAGDLAYGKKE